MPYTRSGVAFATGSDTSYEAALKAQPFVSQQGMEVYRWLQRRTEHGGTQKEAEQLLCIGRPSICARFKALEDAGAIGKTDERRLGCAVYRVTGRQPEQLRLLG